MKSTLVFALSLVLCAASAFGLDRVKVRDAEFPYMPYTSISGAVNISNAKADLEKKATAAPADLSLQLSLGIVYMNMSLEFFPKGVTGYAQKSADILEAVLKNPALPADLRPLALAYAGSAKALIGNEDVNPANKIGKVNEGFKYLDEAVGKYKNDSFYPCFIRANVASSLPDFFKKEEGLKKDLDFLIQETAKDPAFTVKENLSAAYAMMGDWNKRKKKMNEALAAWKKAVELDPELKGGGKAAKKMLAVYDD